MKLDLKVALLVVTFALTTVILLAISPVDGMTPAEGLIKVLITVADIVGKVLVVLLKVIFVVLNVLLSVIAAILRTISSVIEFVL